MTVTLRSSNVNNLTTYCAKEYFSFFFLFYQPNKNVAINRQIYLRGECCTRGWVHSWDQNTFFSCPGPNVSCLGRPDATRAQPCGLIEHDMSSNIAKSHNSHEQPESQPEVNTSWTSYFYKSYDWKNMIMRNF